MPARLVRGTRGAVASPHNLASRRVRILRAGGNAVDAAIATNAAPRWSLHIVRPGGRRLLADLGRLHDPCLNGSGRSARTATIEAATRSLFEEMPVRGPWTITVPGAIRSWGDAYARFGRLPRPNLLAPAIDLADGFPASDGWASSIERSASLFGERGDWAQTFPPARPTVEGR